MTNSLDLYLHAAVSMIISIFSHCSIFIIQSQNFLDEEYQINKLKELEKIFLKTNLSKRKIKLKSHSTLYSQCSIELSTSIQLLTEKIKLSIGIDIYANIQICIKILKQKDQMNVIEKANRSPPHSTVIESLLHLLSGNQ